MCFWFFQCDLGVFIQRGYSCGQLFCCFGVVVFGDMVDCVESGGYEGVEFKFVYGLICLFFDFYYLL